MGKNVNLIHGLIFERRMEMNPMFFTVVGVCFTSWVFVYRILPWLEGERK